MNATSALLLALLSIYRPPAQIRIRIEAHREQIVADAAAASDESHVPIALLLYVGFAESHLGMDRNEGGNWGAPIDRFHRHTAGTAFHAARALAWSFRVCHNWNDAVARFRTGLCRPRGMRGYSAARAVRTAAMLYMRAGLPMPDGLTYIPRRR